MADMELQMKERQRKLECKVLAARREEAKNFAKKEVGREEGNCFGWKVSWRVNQIHHANWYSSKEFQVATIVPVDYTSALAESLTLIVCNWNLECRFVEAGIGVETYLVP